MLSFVPADDASIKSASPSSNYGSETSLKVDNDTVKHLLLRFNVSGAAGRTVTSAKLRLYCLDSAGAGGDFHRVLNRPESLPL